MGFLVMILDYIINGEFPVLFHEIIFLGLLQLCLLRSFVLRSLLF